MDDLESNLVEFFGQWEAFNVIPIGGKADSDDGADDEQVDEDDLVKYELKQKVACANPIIRAIRTIGAPCFNSSAVTEKGHIRVNHALRLSKGVNRMINSTRQYLRLNFLRLRHVRTQADEAARIAAEEQARREADEDAAHAAAVGKTAVMRKFGRGVDANDRALRGMSEPQRNRANLSLHPRAHGRASVGGNGTPTWRCRYRRRVRTDRSRVGKHHTGFCVHQRAVATGTSFAVGVGDSESGHK